MKNADFRKWQAALGATLSVLLAFTLAWASPMGGGFSQAAALGVVTADAVPMSDGAASGEGQAASKTVLDAAAESEASDAANAGAFEQAAADVGRAEPEVEESSAEPASGAEAVLAQTDADEAQRAAEERATDVDELGYVPGEIVVIYEEDASVSEQSDVAATIGTEGEPEPASFETGDAAVVDIVDEITVDTAVEAASAEDAVKYAFPNYVAKSFDEPVASAQSSAASPLATGDELASQQWYLSAVKAPEAWSLLAAPGRSIEPVKVAVLDTGASISHSDLQDSIDMSRSGEVVWVDMQAGKVSFKPLRGDGYLNGTNEMPFYSTHGTHVVGIIGAKAGNGGVLGVASGGSTALANKIVSIAAIDIFSCIGENNDGTKFSSATVLDILYGLAKARDMGCSVVNMSLGFYTDDETCIAALNEKTSELDEQGVVQVCAAGNDHTAAKSYPAACDATLSVISLSKRGAIPSNSSTYSMKTWESADGYMRSWFSNYGDWCDIAAPGENIFSTGVFEGTLKNGYLSMSGTSMASPVVAAAAALVQAADPDLSASEVKDVLCRTAADLHAAGKGNESGWGLVNAEAAVKAALPSSQPEGPGVEPDIPEEEPPASLANAKLAIPSLTYTGKVQTPAVSVTLGGATLVQGRDYRAAISPATVKAVGTYSVTVEGVGAYRGTLRGSFKVNAADISSAQIQAIGSQNYTGKAVTPQPKVTWQSVTLAAGTDYAVSYANNVNAGTAKMAISGKGNFTGTKSVNFSIVKVDRNVWKTVGGKTYYYGADGQPVKWSQKIGGSWYYFNGAGVMQRGWITWRDGTKSYFDWDGKALTGWRSFGGVKYYFDPATGVSKRWSQRIDGKWYYFDGKSVMQKGWVTWSDGTKSYFHPDSSGHAAALTGWRSFSGVKYYFDPDTGISKRWSQKIDGKWYYFDSSSRMKAGWVTWSDGTKSYFHPDPSGHAAALTGWRSFSGVKYYFDSSTGKSLRWGQKISGNFYYFNSSSQMHRGWLTWSDGKKSYFNSNGCALAGWQSLAGKRYYFDPSTYKTSGPEGQSSGDGSRTVYWVANGEVYHTTRDCVSLKRSTNIKSGTIAQSGKKRVCSNCG